MLDKDNVVIYVGKAKNLKNRVTTYFRQGFKTEKVAKMVMNIADFYYVITPNEADALSLENNLIKKYKPKYNILLKDDKTYPYIKVHTKEEFPRVSITRKLKKDGKYFGPYTSSYAVNDIIKTIQKTFRIPDCEKKFTYGKRICRPCGI